jgi:hypothetical protein
MAVIIAVPVMLVIAGTAVAMAGAIGMNMVVLMIMLPVVIVIVPVAIADSVGVSVSLGVGMAVLTLVAVIAAVTVAGAVGVGMIVVVGMTAHGSLLSGLKIQNRGAFLVPASAMPAHQATSTSSSMLLIFSSSPRNRWF